MVKVLLASLIWAAAALASTPIPDDCLSGYQTLGIDTPGQRSAAFSRYGLIRGNSNSGFSGEVVVGTLPADFRKSIPTAPPDWNPGMKIRVKIPIGRGGKWTAANQWALVHEANVSELIAPLDPKGIFVRTIRDTKLNVDVMKDASPMIPMRDWLDRVQGKLSPPDVKAIDAQLNEALGILKRGKVVHSDLNLANILIDPKTLKILVIDYGISATPDGYAPHLKHIGSNGLPIRGGVMPFMTLSQAKGAPAAFADDEHAMQALKHELERSEAENR